MMRSSSSSPRSHDSIPFGCGTLRFSQLLFATLLYLSPAAQALDCVQASSLVQEGAKLRDGSTAELERYRRAIELCPTMPEAFAAQAGGLQRAGELAGALASVEKGMELRPSVELRVLRGTILIGLKRYEEALETLTRALKDAPRSVAVLQGLSLLAEQRADLTEAIRYLEEAEQIDPRDKVTLFNAAVLRGRRGEIQEAVVLLERLTSANGKDAEGWYLLGVNRLKLRQFSSGLVALQRAVELNSNDARYHHALSRAFELEQDLDRAELSVRKAIAIGGAADPDHLDRVVGLAGILIKRRQPALALELLNPMIAAHPDDGELLGAQGSALLELGRSVEAENVLRRAVVLSPTLASALNNLGVVLERAGQREEAARFFQRARQEDPALAAAAENVSRTGAAQR